MRAIASVVLILTGILLIVAPVSSYYFNTYLNSPFKGAIQPGSRFEYCGVIGSFWDNSSHKSFMVGVLLNVTVQSKDNYLIEYSIYRLMGKGQLNVKRTPHFIAQKIILVNNGSMKVDNRNSILGQLFLKKLNASTAIHTFPDSFYGYPLVYLSGRDYYLKYPKRYVALSVSLKDPCQFIGTLYPKGKEYCEFLHREYGNETEANEYLMSEFDLVGGNTVPNQDWKGWVRYGFGWSFPVNVAFMMLGLIVYIVESRRK